MKFFLSVCLILSLISTNFADRVKWGKAVGDKLLYRIDVVRAPIPGFAQDVYVVYPRDGEKVDGEEIVDIWVNGRYPDANGAIPVLAYGVEKDINGRIETATVILRGQRSQGINSTVEFYGKK